MQSKILYNSFIFIICTELSLRQAPCSVSLSSICLIPNPVSDKTFLRSWEIESQARLLFIVLRYSSARRRVTNGLVHLVRSYEQIVHNGLVHHKTGELTEPSTGGQVEDPPGGALRGGGARPRLLWLRPQGSVEGGAGGGHQDAQGQTRQGPERWNMRLISYKISNK